MNKKVLILVIALAVIAAGIVVYLKTGGGGDKEIDNLLVPTAAADIYEETNRLEVLEGSVTIKRVSGEEEVIADEVDVNVGDTIIVSEDGKATLYWFDHSISRLASGTELTIDQAAYNPENINEADIDFEVISGEVWSKVQAIVDEDSEFLGYAGNVVAGVRGSVFNLAVKDDEVVVDAIAHALTVGDATMTSGQQGSFKKSSGDKVSVDSIPAEVWDRDWFKNNLESDKVDQKRMMAAMMEKLRNAIGVLPGEPSFNDRLSKLDEFMKSDADPKEKEAVKAKIVALVRAMDILPGDKLYSTKVKLQELLLAWETNQKRKEFLMRKSIEARLFALYDWVQANDPTMEEVKAYLSKFRDLLGSDYEFFVQNPELIALVEQIIATLQEKLPELNNEVEFLRVINALQESGDPTFDPTIRSAPVWNIEVQDPAATNETRDVIEDEAPFYRGESPV